MKVKLSELEPIIQEQLQKAGIDRISKNGITIYIERKLWAKVPDKEAAVERLKATDLAHYVEEKFNSNAISAYVRELEGLIGEMLPSCERLAELENLGIKLPPEAEKIKDVIGVSEVFKVRTRLG